MVQEHQTKLSVSFQSLHLWYTPTTFPYKELFLLRQQFTSVVHRKDYIICPLISTINTWVCEIFPQSSFTITVSTVWFHSHEQRIEINAIHCMIVKCWKSKATMPLDGTFPTSHSSPASFRLWHHSVHHTAIYIQTWFLSGRIHS